MKNFLILGHTNLDFLGQQGMPFLFSVHLLFFESFEQEFSEMYALEKQLSYSESSVPKDFQKFFVMIAES